MPNAMVQHAPKKETKSSKEKLGSERTSTPVNLQVSDGVIGTKREITFVNVGVMGVRLIKLLQISRKNWME